MDALRVFIRFCETIDGVRPNLHDKVRSITLNDDEKTGDRMLEADDAKALLDHLSRFRYASFEHTLLELLWHTRMRVGTAQELDVTDYRPRKAILEVQNRPQTDTPLKNNRDGERLIALSGKFVCSPMIGYSTIVPT